MSDTICLKLNIYVCRI